VGVCNGFYPVHCKNGKMPKYVSRCVTPCERSGFWMRSDGESSSCHSKSKEEEEKERQLRREELGVECRIDLFSVVGGEEGGDGYFLVNLNVVKFLMTDSFEDGKREEAEKKKDPGLISLREAILDRVRAFRHAYGTPGGGDALVVTWCVSASPIMDFSFNFNIYLPVPCAEEQIPLQ